MDIEWSVERARDTAPLRDTAPPPKALLRDAALPPDIALRGLLPR